MFHYLYWQDQSFYHRLRNTAKWFVRTSKFHYSTSYAFDVFLDYVQRARGSDSVYKPLGLRFSTHTAPMWDDITDYEGRILLKAVFRLENLVEGINRAFTESGIDRRIDNNIVTINKSSESNKHKPNKSQRRKIENIYHHDFDLYENV
jgi:hypothetical protein